MRIDGIEHGDGITARVLEKLIRQEQKRLAAMFDRQLTVRGPLRANDPDYTRRKLSQGFSGKLGHRTGQTQSVMDRRVLWSVKVVRKKGRKPYAILQFLESRIIKLAPQYEHYRDSMRKTPSEDGVLIVTKRFAGIMQRVLRRVQTGVVANEDVTEEAEVEWRRFAA